MGEFDQICSLLNAPIADLQGEDLQKRTKLAVMKALNQHRELYRLQALHLDDLCSQAAVLAVQRTDLDAVVREMRVVGSDFEGVRAEKTLQMQELASNEKVMKAFLGLLDGLDANSACKLRNIYKTHCGIALKQVQSLLIIQFIVFRKAICLNHVQFTPSEGVEISGKLLDSNIRLCAVSIQGREAMQQETLSGPSQICMKNADFEVKIPKNRLISLSNREKEVKIYGLIESNGINWSGDIVNLPAEAVLVHIMAFRRLWESNVLFEGRNMQDSVRIWRQFEQKRAKSGTGIVAKGTKREGNRQEIGCRDNGPVRDTGETAYFPPSAPTAAGKAHYGPSAPSVFQFPPFVQQFQSYSVGYSGQNCPFEATFVPIPLSSTQFPVEFAFSHTFPANSQFIPTGLPTPQAFTDPFPSKIAQNHTYPSVKFAKSPALDSSPQQKHCQTSPLASPKPDSDADTVSFPCFLLPLPTSLFQQVSNFRPEKVGNREMWANRSYWDVVIKVKDKEIKAHKGVLAVCSFFKAQLQSSQRLSSGSIRIIMPIWVQERPLQLVLLHLYQCDIDKEGLDLSLAQETLILADFLDIRDLAVCLIVKHIVLKLTKETVLSIAQFAVLRGREGNKEAWDFLADYSCQYAGQHLQWLIGNCRRELLAVAGTVLLKTATAALQYHYNSSFISLLVPVLIEAGLAEDALSLCSKISTLSLFACQSEAVDPREVDFLRPYEKQDFAKLPEEQIMEFESVEEEEPWLTSVQRQSPVHPLLLDPDINLCIVPIPSLENPHTFTSKEKFKSVPLMEKEKFGLNCLKPLLTITIDDLARERSLISPTFETENCTWFLTIVLHSANISVFLCERDQHGTGEEALYTTALWEIGLETKNYAQTSVFLYSFPNGHYQCVGERWMWRNGDLTGFRKVGISIRMRELQLYSAVIQYINEHFETFNCSKYRYFKALNVYDFRSLLIHTKLPITAEKAAVSALWKYSVNRDFGLIDCLIPAIRWPFLSISDLCSIARDHFVLRQCSNFRYIFNKELQRRLQGPAEVDTEPRTTYGRKEKAVLSENHPEVMLNWLLMAEHHEGFSRKIDEHRKKYEAERTAFEGKSLELASRKQELYLENERLQAQIKTAYSQMPAPCPPQTNCVVM